MRTIFRINHKTGSPLPWRTRERLAGELFNSGDLRRYHQRENRNHEVEKQSPSWVIVMLCQPLLEGTTTLTLLVTSQFCLLNPVCSLGACWHQNFLLPVRWRQWPKMIELSITSPGGQWKPGRASPTVGQWHPVLAVQQNHVGITRTSPCLSNARNNWIRMASGGTQGSVMPTIVQVIPICSKVGNHYCRRPVVLGGVGRKN